MLKIALSIAGSDSSAGAGIQSDLKTFFSIGVYGCTVLTALTAQNTTGISRITEIDPDMVCDQIEAIISDLPISAIKIGMVYSKRVIKAVAGALKDSKVPLVLDPIMRAGTGQKLLQEDATVALLTELFPLSSIITPNKEEAEQLSGRKIRTTDEAIFAARKILNKGAKNIIVKGGHLRGKYSTDILLESDGSLSMMRYKRIGTKDTHGTGCNFSAAIAAFLARGFSLAHSCALAGQYTQDTLAGAIVLGKGHPINIPQRFDERNADRYVVAQKLQMAVNEIIKIPGFHLLIPETQSNFGYALLGAQSLNDVAAVSGRIVRVGDRAIQVSHVQFGASTHVASAILALMAYSPLIRSAVNVKCDKKLLEIIKTRFNVAKYDRHAEPKDIRLKEGATIPWGIGVAITSNPHAEVIYHEGAVGKEPMIILFGENPLDVLQKVELLVRAY